MKIVLASNNSGKLREISTLMQNKGVQIIPQSDDVGEVLEVGMTFVENALLKARKAAVLTDLPVMADDSGLVVPALHGAPGIISARYAGERATSKDNIDRLLQELKDISTAQRHAFFFCTIVLLRCVNDPCPFISEGIWYGTILSKPRGDKGFGYDPIFFVPDYQCSAAELPLEVKNEVSHRGQAIKKLKAKLDLLSSQWVT